MDKRAQPQWAVSGVIEAPVERVWEALLDASPDLSSGDKRAIALHTGAQPFTITRGKPGEGRIHIEVDRQRRSIAAEGEWWYRGVISVEPHARGSLLAYRVYNIAPGASWWAAQLVQGPSHARRMRETHLQPLLDAITRRLNCVAY